MCGRFTLTVTEAVVLDLFEVQRLPALEARYNIAPTQQVLAVRTGDDEQREAVMLRWGLVPHWADDLSIGNRLINARAETVADKPAFRDAFARHRCLVVADGFIEWKRSNRQKQPYWVQLADGGPFGFAGLWARWRDEAGEWLESCTIITTTPNELVAPIHDRMPVMIPGGRHAEWLDERTPPEELQALLQPFPADLMRATAISSRVNHVANDDPGCLEPSEVQGSLL